MLRIITFGGCLLRRDDGTEVPVPRRRMALLLVVTAAGARGVSRDKLLHLLWPELDEERGRAALSQALYALRKDLGSEDAIAGTADLRADPAQITIDRNEFLAAIAEGQDEIAVMAYRGPYLDGFHVREAPEFEEEIARERHDLAARYAAALERLARQEGDRGDHAAAVRLWRQRANLDPTDAGVAVALMRAMAAAGDRAGALRHAEVYTEILKTTADLPPEPMVLEAAAEIRGGAKTPSAISHPTSAPAASSEPVIHAGSSKPDGTSDSGDRIADRGYRRAFRPVLWLVAGVTVFLLVGRFVWSDGFPAHPQTRVVAVTDFQDFAGDSLTGPLTELLRTALADVPGLSVISAERMAEGRVRTPADAPLGVARAAGATEALTGALYRRPDGKLRFDLRRVDAADGRVLETFTLDGTDVFDLTTHATRRLLERYGVPQPDGELTTVSSSSLTAIRLYQAGLDAMYRGEARAAYSLFTDAVREDSSFAMAELYAGLVAADDPTRTAHFERAHLLGRTASLREHLIIDVNRADFNSSPEVLALAESLTTLFPREMSGHFALARGQIYQAGDFLGAAKEYRETLRYDSVGFTGIGRKCDACALRGGLLFAWMFADSFPEARRAAEEWTRAIPGDPSAWRYLGVVALFQGDTATYRSARARAAALDPDFDHFYADFFAALYGSDLERADSVLQGWIAAAHPDQIADLRWIEAQLRREQGRPAAAVAAMREWRRRSGPALHFEAVYQAQTYFDAGDYRRAAALWDSVARMPNPFPSREARGWTWARTLQASALAALGDTARLLPLADSIRVRSQGSGFLRDRRLDHHLRGLYWVARGDDARALAEFRESIWSLTAGYTRTDLEMGRVLLRLGQPREAAKICGSGLRAEMSASAQYVSRGELHDCVGRAWLAAGEKDSARVHLELVARQWQDAEPAWAPRRDSVRTLLESIEPRKP